MARFFCAAIVCLVRMVISTFGAVSSTSPDTPMKGSDRTLTFEQRVVYQRAIEDVYWRHRIWPKENGRPKPPLNAMISQAQLENKVECYLHGSVELETHGQRITAEKLQSEMDRMAQHTKQPTVLRELFAALGNDPFVIAECLARPMLADRLAARSNNVPSESSRARSRSVVERRFSDFRRFLDCARNDTSDNTDYQLPDIAVPSGCSDDSWTATSAADVPDVRRNHTAVWTGSEMVVWGGYNFNNNQLNTLNTGGRYDPATDNWMATTITNAPIGRGLHTAVWTGNDVVVWGGYNYPAGDLNDGGRYNPATDSWAPMSIANAPSARESHSAVWTRSAMIIWGGRNNSTWFNSGGRYNPSTDSWTATSTANAPEARWAHTAEWTGSEMIVWGGTNQTIYLNTGAKYNPTDNSWTPTSTGNAPLGRVSHTAIWSGSEMMVWGGTDSTFNDTNTGGRYNATVDSWTATSLVNAPSPRDSLAAVWTGSEMIIWGGAFCCPPIDFNTGGRYSPDTDSWTTTSTTNVPFARYNHTAVWTGSEMIIWGGYNYELQVFFNTGGRYCAQSEATPTPTPTATPTPSATPNATATPRETPTPRARPTAHLRP